MFQSVKKIMHLNIFFILKGTIRQRDLHIQYKGKYTCLLNNNYYPFTHKLHCIIQDTLRKLLLRFSKEKRIRHPKFS